MTSSIMKDILQQAENIASSFKCLLIIGEYGSGRSWLAKRIHHSGDRSTKPFITVNCRIIEEYEAFKKVFGHLTLTKAGARINHGSLEQSQGGTVFFENFDSLSENVQKEVVKTIHSSRIRRADSKQTLKIDLPRIICSIEIKPSHIFQKKEFLTDTMLSSDPHVIGQPPLRQRREDIAPLIHTFLNQKFRNRQEVSTKKVSPKVIYQCIKYDWPGNVRQLKNAIEHAAITSGHNVIQPADLPISIKPGQQDSSGLEDVEKSPSYINAEKQLFKSVLLKAGSHTKASELLGIDQDVFIAKAEELEILNVDSGLKINHSDKK